MVPAVGVAAGADVWRWCEPVLCPVRLPDVKDRDVVLIAPEKSFLPFIRDVHSLKRMRLLGGNLAKFGLNDLTECASCLGKQLNFGVPRGSTIYNATNRFGTEYCVMHHSLMLDASYDVRNYFRACICKHHYSLAPQLLVITWPAK